MHSATTIPTEVATLAPSAPPSPPPADRTFDRGELSIEGQVQRGLNLFLPLKNPAQFGALKAALDAKQEATRHALESLNYVHFARFVPTPDYSSLIVVTEYDGDLKSYVMDFVAVLGDVFNAILDFVDGAPRLPVQKYPDEFWAFVQSHNVDVDVWSAYPHRSVIDVLRGRRAVLGAPDTAERPAPRLDLNDIQGNVLRGVRAGLARHFLLEITDPKAASACLWSLTPDADDDGLKVSTAAEWKEKRPEYFLNVGLTFAGLTALGLPEPLLKAFPAAFQRGPAAAGVPTTLGDDDPSTWDFGNDPASEHVVVSLYTGYRDVVSQERLSDLTARLRDLFARYGLKEVGVQDAQAHPDGEVHFGYKDGIAQPRVEGAPGRQPADMQPASRAGEFLLGRDYVNQYDGNFLGALPNALGDNGTFGALRKAEQDVFAFERFIREAGARANMDPELIAAKLMGRWRNGNPLTLWPDEPGAPKPTDEAPNAYDYAPTAAHRAYYDDADGVRCPIGAHARRMNPRGALVMGKPHSRRIVRRGMPYGTPIDWKHFDPATPDDGVKRGLLGYFLCGDLESQFEFMLATWANSDFSTTGMRGTRDPIIGAQPPSGGAFIIRTEDGRDPIVLTGLPKWTSTKGSLYCFLPGVGGLRYLGRRAWEADASGPLGYTPMLGVTVPNAPNAPNAGPPP